MRHPDAELGPLLGKRDMLITPRLGGRDGRFDLPQRVLGPAGGVDDVRQEVAGDVVDGQVVVGCIALAGEPVTSRVVVEFGPGLAEKSERGALRRREVDLFQPSRVSAAVCRKRFIIHTAHALGVPKPVPQCIRERADVGERQRNRPPRRSLGLGGRFGPGCLAGVAGFEPATYGFGDRRSTS